MRVCVCVVCVCCVCVAYHNVLQLTWHLVDCVQTGRKIIMQAQPPSSEGQCYCHPHQMYLELTIHRRLCLCLYSCYMYPILIILLIINQSSDLLVYRCSLGQALSCTSGTCRLATSRYLLSLAHQVLKMQPHGALLFEGPYTLKTHSDKREAVSSEGKVKGDFSLNSSVEEQTSVELAVKGNKDQTLWV